MDTNLDAITFLEAYKTMCGEYNCTSECPIKQLLDKHDIEVCDDAFIYLYPSEVVGAVIEWLRQKHPSKAKKAGA